MFRGKTAIVVGGLSLLAGGALLVLLVWPEGIGPFFEPAAKSHRVHERQKEAAPELPALDIFRDMTATSGVNFTCRNGEEADHYTLLESLGSGVALFDFDHDGLLDIFLVGGGHFGGDDKKQILGQPCRLYKNLGNWKFRDVTAEVFGEPPSFYSHGCAVADYDCDGWPDLLVTGIGRLALFHNEDDGKGGRRFVDVTHKAGLSGYKDWATSAGWADLDGDGFPELYVCNYVDWSFAKHKSCPGDTPEIPRDVCPPQTFQGMPHTLFRNHRNGTFTDVSREAGIKMTGPMTGMGLGVVIVDVDGDRRPDIYAVNDTTPNFLYRNQSSPGKLQFQDVSYESGVALADTTRPNGSMGVDAADYDGCGRPSLWVTTFESERHALYRNDCVEDRILFRYKTYDAGIAALGTTYVGFGTAFVDVDGDGWEDIIISHGHVRRHATRGPLRQRPVYFRNLGNGRFLNSGIQGGAYFQESHRGRGLAVGDLDNDGRPDLVITHLNDPVVLLRNDPKGELVAKQHWLGLDLVGKKHRDIAGAKIVVEVAGRKLTRFTKGGGSYLSASDRRNLVGLGSADQVERVTVVWPWGEEQSWTGVTADRYWRLIEGTAKAE